MNNFGMYWHQHHWSGHHWNGGWIALIILIVLLVLAFELWMLVDCITNKKVPTRHKVWWIIGMFLLHPFVAIAYFFTSRFHYNKLKPTKS
ncbi:MAG TPA: PLDc N-terminal domain-containing protein [Candidatus Saccharimonadales bacterium]|jgi:hypothetical protein